MELRHNSVFLNQLLRSCCFSPDSWTAELEFQDTAIDGGYLNIPFWRLLHLVTSDLPSSVFSVI